MTTTAISNPPTPPPMAILGPRPMPPPEVVLVSICMPSLKVIGLPTPKSVSAPLCCRLPILLHTPQTRVSLHGEEFMYPEKTRATFRRRRCVYAGP
ncbi:hypothetical protein [Mycobacteroides abscessus]|uniref:hypothetical protein n=1 Tax=Mycobacteroides abscessus TaxID=36809 RepID=UPI001F3755F7|nr:hypothetical protein [Mycobacteroides abscessus]